MKYKVGDKVRVRSDLVTDEEYGGWIFSNNMVNKKGTILTVVREAADYTYAYTTTEDVTDCMDVMKKMVEEANASLQRTPE